VHEIDQMVAFYCDTLGFEVTDRGPLRTEEIVFLSQTANAHHQVALVSGRERPAASDNLHHVAFRSGGTLDDLRSLHQVLAADSRVTQIMPLTHGNAWSVYFRDPEFNGVEVFIDTPWHVRQPQGEPLDLSRPNDEIVEWTNSFVAGLSTSTETSPEARGVDRRRPRTRRGACWSGSVCGLEQFDWVAGWIVEHNLCAAGAGDDVTAELDACCSQSVDFAADVIDDQMDAVPATGDRLASIGERSRSGAGRAAEQEPERAAGDVCERWREVGQLGESEVFRVEVERGRDISDDVADAGVFAVLHG
jgi:catechol 2,3-dioxygenase